jgi:hypothetical protein
MALRKVLILVMCSATLAAAASISLAEETVRIATYNVRFLNAGIGEDRLEHLWQVVENLDADVIGLREIDDRAALELAFPADEWHTIIDDGSGDAQDLVLVVRKRFRVLDFDGDGLDASDEHFLFPESSDWRFFPRRGDVLCVQIGLPAEPTRKTRSRRGSPSRSIDWVLCLVHGS